MEIHRKSWKFIEYRRCFFCHLLWRIRNSQVRGRLGCSDSPQLQTREGNKDVEMVQHYLKACNVVTLIHHILDLWWSMIDNDRQRVLAFPIQTCTVNCQIVLAKSAGPLSPVFMTFYDLILKLKVKHLLCAVQASDRTAQFQNIPFSTFAESFSGLIVEFSFDL